MSRYIDADEFKNRRCIVCFRDEKTGEEGALELDVSRFLDMIPTNANVVEVVRCKECRFNPKRSWVSCPIAGKDTRKDDDFCSYGEKVSG